MATDRDLDDPRRRQLTVAGAAIAAVVILLLLVLLVGGGGDDDATVGSGTTSTADVGDTTTTPDGDDAPTTSAPSSETTAAEPEPSEFVYGTGECAPEEKPAEPVVRFPDAPRRCIVDGVDYAAVLSTDLGDITIDLLEDQAPGTVNNFVTLARYGTYDGTVFHRVIPTFVAQGGDPVGDPPGTGDIGYTIPDELPEPGAYEVGSVAMANRFQAQTGQGADSGSSQFFIVTGDNGAALPPYYSLFGEVTDGMDVVEEIEARGSESGTPEEVVTVTSVEILER